MGWIFDIISLLCENSINQSRTHTIESRTKERYQEWYNLVLYNKSLKGLFTMLSVQYVFVFHTMYVLLFCDSRASKKVYDSY